VQAEAAAQGRTLTDEQLKTRLAAIMQVPVRFLEEPDFANGAADDTLARGFEFEANYNPTNAWTVKLNFTKQETLNERIAPELQQWVNERMPVWQSIIADDDRGLPRGVGGRNETAASKENRKGAPLAKRAAAAREAIAALDAQGRWIRAGRMTKRAPEEPLILTGEYIRRTAVLCDYLSGVDSIQQRK